VWSRLEHVVIALPVGIALLPSTLARGY